jgi:hypothetical protein
MWMKLACLCKQGRDAHTVARIPGGFKLLQDCLNGFVVCCDLAERARSRRTDDYPPANQLNPTTWTYRPRLQIFRLERPKSRG